MKAGDSVRILPPALCHGESGQVAHPVFDREDGIQLVRVHVDGRGLYGYPVALLQKVKGTGSGARAKR